MSERDGLCVDWISTRDGFLALEDEWESLVQASADTVFLTHFWLSAWLRAYGERCELRVLTARADGRLVAALPLVARGRRWAFMGAGILTPNHLDVIALPEYREEAASLFSGALLDASDDWDVLDLDKIPEDSTTPALMASASEARGLSASLAVSAVCPYADLPETFDEYLAARSKRTRSNAGKKARRLEREQPAARFGMVGTAEELDAALEALVTQHQANWEERGYAGAFGDPRSMAFHRDAAAGALARDRLRCRTLRIDDEIAAVWYGFRTGDTVQGYQSSFDQRWTDLSTGMVLLAHSIEQCIAEGARRIDYLEGQEEYKAKWCPTQRRDLRLRIFNRTLRGRLAQTRERSGEAVVTAARRMVPAELRESYVKVMSRVRARA